MVGQGNRGAAFENLINYTNESYEHRGVAVINKRSTPVKVTRSKGTKVLAGFFEAKSTVDYDGIYRGRAVFFEAKSVQELDRFDLKNVEDHQYEHLEKCHKFGALCFVLVEFRKQRKTYLLPFTALRAYKVEASRGGRKSMTLDNFEIDAFEVRTGRVPLDYLAAVDRVWFAEGKMNA
ncbi:Holliday junction resolvase RecU [Paenibacillus sp. FSL R5-0475]|uniref:Holliday junction resolvase RecU n=1 Tax=Paenibacillus sp. FSL R5-0475 TaxID=2921643 RepID=UPI0030FD0E2D